MGAVTNGGLNKGTRVIALVGPAGAGKTSVAEAMLFAAGATDRLGSTANGSSVGDSSPEARSRGGSTELNLYNFDYLGDSFAVIDCPGSVGFAADGARALALFTTIEATARHLAAHKLAEPPRAASSSSASSALHGRRVDVPMAGRVEDEAEVVHRLHDLARPAMLDLAEVLRACGRTDDSDRAARTADRRAARLVHPDAAHAGEAGADDEQRTVDQRRQHVVGADAHAHHHHREQQRLRRPGRPVEPLEELVLELTDL